MPKQFSDGDGGAHSAAEIAKLRTALEQIVAIKHDTLGPRTGNESADTKAFDRGSRMAFYRCSDIASKALG